MLSILRQRTVSGPGGDPPKVLWTVEDKILSRRAWILATAEVLGETLAQSRSCVGVIWIGRHIVELVGIGTQIIEFHSRPFAERLLVKLLLSRVAVASTPSLSPCPRRLTACAVYPRSAQCERKPSAQHHAPTYAPWTNRSGRELGSSAGDSVTSSNSGGERELPDTVDPRDRSYINDATRRWDVGDGTVPVLAARETS